MGTVAFLIKCICSEDYVWRKISFQIINRTELTVKLWYKNIPVQIYVCQLQLTYVKCETVLIE